MAIEHRFQPLRALAIGHLIKRGVLAHCRESPAGGLRRTARDQLSREQQPSADGRLRRRPAVPGRFRSLTLKRPFGARPHRFLPHAPKLGVLLEQLGYVPSHRAKGERVGIDWHQCVRRLHRRGEQSNGPLRILFRLKLRLEELLVAGGRVRNCGKCRLLGVNQRGPQHHDEQPTTYASESHGVMVGGRAARAGGSGAVESVVTIMTRAQRLVQWAALIAASGITASVMTACASPTIRIDGLERVDSTADATEYALTLTVTNPGSTALALERWEFGGDCGGRAFDPSVWAATRTLPAHGSTSLRLPLILPGAATDATQWTATGTLFYRQREKLLETIHDLGWPYPTESFAARGTSLTPGAEVPSALE